MVVKRTARAEWDYHEVGHVPTESSRRASQRRASPGCRREQKTVPSRIWGCQGKRLKAKYTLNVLANPHTAKAISIFRSRPVDKAKPARPLNSHIFPILARHRSGYILFSRIRSSIPLP
jgi:hypothetical protein